MIRLRVVHGRADLLVVGFHPLSHHAAPDAPFWGQRLAEKYGLSWLAIESDGVGWFPQVEMLAVVEEARVLIANYPTRLFYGYSMGAYAALKYSRQLGADTVLALAPQVSIDPAQVGDFDQRYVAHFSSELHAGMQLTASDLGGRCYWVYDPRHAVDAEHLRRLCSDAVRPVAVPHIGHYPIELATRSGGFLQLAELVQDPRIDQSAQLARLFRQVKRDCPSFLYRVALALQRKGHVAQARANMQRVLQQKPEFTLALEALRRLDGVAWHG